jgi:hypothetical protein
VQLAILKWKSLGADAREKWRLSADVVLIREQFASGAPVDALVSKAEADAFRSELERVREVIDGFTGDPDVAAILTPGVIANLRRRTGLPAKTASEPQ